MLRCAVLGPINRVFCNVDHLTVVYRGNPRGDILKAVARATRITVDNRGIDRG